MLTPKRPDFSGADDFAWAFGPASVSNVACGFDVLGFALSGDIGDWVGARRRTTPGVRIAEIVGDDGMLPREATNNTAGVAAASLLDALNQREDAGVLGVELVIHKSMPISSGIGSSAASAAAAAAATNAVFGSQLGALEVLDCALDGECLASGSRHADNVGPALLGGLLAVRSLSPAPDIVHLPTPSLLSCALVLPRIEISTSAAREALGSTATLADAVAQSANLAALVHALHTADYELLARSLEDRIAEPVRKAAVPGFDQAMSAAREAGALGGSLSGSGPAVFALCRENSEHALNVAKQASEAMLEALRSAGTSSTAVAARISTDGAFQWAEKLADYPANCLPELSPSS